MKFAILVKNSLIFLISPAAIPVLIFFVFNGQALHAGDATWLVNPASNDWNSASNWSLPTVPNAPGDTAAFGQSSITNISLTTDIEVQALVFHGPSAYNIGGIPGVFLTIGGTGITNNSANSQTISPAGIKLITDQTWSAAFGGLNVTSSVVLDSFTNLTIAGGANTVISGNVTQTGPGAITKTGTGTLNLSGNNSYTGNTTINGGILRTVGGNAIGDSSRVTVFEEGNFSLNDREIIGSLAGYGTVQAGSTSATLVTGGNNSNTVFTGLLKDNGSARLALVKVGSGTFTVHGSATLTNPGITPNNTFSGGTTIEEGVLLFSGYYALGRGELTINGGELRSSDVPVGYVSDFYTPAINIASGTTATISTEKSYWMIGAGKWNIGNDVTLNFGSEENDGLLYVSSYVAQDFSNITGLALNLNHGRLTDQSGGHVLASLTEIAASTTVASGAILEAYASYPISRFVIANLQGAGQVRIAPFAPIAIKSGNFSGVISGSESLEKIGSGTLILSGSNTYNGGTTISEGTLVVQGGAVLPDDSRLIVGQAGTLALDDSETIGSLSGTGTVRAGTGSSTLTVDVVENDNSGFEGILEDSGSSRLGLNKTGRGTFFLYGINEYTGDTNINQGRLVLQSSEGFNSSRVYIHGGTVDGNIIGGGDGGLLRILETATLRGTQFISKGGTAPRTRGGLVVLEQGADAGNGTFFTEGGVVSDAWGGAVILDSARAGTAAFLNYGGVASGSMGGETTFRGNTTLGRNEIYNSGFGLGGGGITHFFDVASGGKAEINNQIGQVLGGVTVFHDRSTAGESLILTYGSDGRFMARGRTLFIDNSTTAASEIVNFGGMNGQGGSTLFEGNANAGSSTIKNFGGSFESGSTIFTDTTSAKSSVITNGGGFGGSTIGGVTAFFGESSADHATLISEGIDGYPGGVILFSDSSTGGMVTVKVFAEGKLDISTHNATGVTIGSLEGTGKVFLGGNTLTVGSNNKSTTFSGVISDDGILEEKGMVTAQSSSVQTDGPDMGFAGVGARHPISAQAGGRRTSLSRAELFYPSSTGKLTKTGSGTLVFSGSNTYTGETNIDNGVLIINGSLKSEDIFVNRVGTLGGSGRVFGNLINDGVVSPGNSPGALNIGGDYLQNSDGALRIEIASPIKFDSLKIRGMADIFGTLEIITMGGFVPAPSDKFTILTAAGGVTGMFSKVDQTLSTARFDVNFLSNEIRLEFVHTQFVKVFDAIELGSFALTPNQRAVARALDDSSNDPQQQKLVEFLLSEHFSDLPQDFDLIAPEELAALFEVVLSNSEVHLQNITDQLSAARSGSNGFTSSLSLSDPTGKKLLNSYDGKSDKGCIFDPSPENKWGVWVGGTGEFVNIGDDFNAKGFDFQTGGITLGIDYRVGPSLIVGIAGSYSHTDTDLTSDGDIDVEGGRLALYGTWFSGGAYVNAVVGGGYNSFDTHRRGLKGFADGDGDGREFDGLLGGGYDFSKGSWKYGPTASVGYTCAGLESFQENGSLAPLEIGSQDEDSLRSRIGGHVVAEFKVRKIKLHSELRAEWQHDYLDDNRSIGASFANGAGTGFTVQGPRLGRDSTILGAGLSIEWTPTLLTYLNYEAEIGRQNYDRQTINGGVRWNF